MTNKNYINCMRLEQHKKAQALGNTLFKLARFTAYVSAQAAGNKCCKNKK